MFVKEGPRTIQRILRVGIQERFEQQPGNISPELDRAKRIKEHQRDIAQSIQKAFQDISHTEIQKIATREKYLSSSEIGIEKLSIKELSDLFRLMFYHDTPEYALCMSCINNEKNGRFNARQIWSIPEKSYLSIEDLDQITPVACCPDCQEQLVFLHEPEATQKTFEAKLEKDAFIGLIQNETTGEVEGFTCAYSRPLHEAVDMEWGNSWGNVWGKAWEEKWKLETKIDHVDKEKLIAKACPVLTNEIRKNNPTASKVTEKTPVLIWNYMINGPHIMGKKTLANFVPTFLTSIALPKETTAVLGEAVINGRPYQNLIQAGFKAIPDVLLPPFILLGSSLHSIHQRFHQDLSKI